MCVCARPMCVWRLVSAFFFVCVCVFVSTLFFAIFTRHFCGSSSKHSAQNVCVCVCMLNRHALPVCIMLFTAWPTPVQTPRTIFVRIRVFFFFSYLPPVHSQLALARPSLLVLKKQWNTVVNFVIIIRGMRVFYCVEAEHVVQKACASASISTCFFVAGVLRHR